MTQTALTALTAHISTFLELCYSHCESQCERQSWKNDEISNIRECNVLKPATKSFLQHNLWFRWLWQLTFQHFLNFAAHIMTHNVRCKSLNEDTHWLELALGSSLETPILLEKQRSYNRNVAYKWNKTGHLVKTQ